MPRRPTVSCLEAVLTALILLASPGEADARKLFLHRFEVGPGCAALSTSALVARVAQEIPREVLRLRGLGYEDLSTYANLADISPNRFANRRGNILRARLQQLDMRYSLWLNLSCLPAGGRARFSLIGRLTDLDAAGVVASCPNESAATRDGRRVCNVNGQVFDAASFTSVDMASFDEFAPALNELLARLLHVPELSLASAIRVFHPGEEIDLPFFVRRNDGTEPGFNGQPASDRSYAMQQDVVEVPSDLYAAVCAAPARRWNQLACLGGFHGDDCDPADRVRFEVRSLVHREIPSAALDPRRGDTTGGDRIVIRAPGHEAFLVLRAEAIAQERGGSVRSRPIFACLHVRERRTYLGFSGRIGVAWPNRHDGSDGRIYPAATILLPLVGIDVTVTRFLFGTKRGGMPQQVLSLQLGYTRYSGVYPCLELNGDCRGRFTASEWSARRHQTESNAIDLNARLRTDLFRIGPFAPMVLAELGAGVDITSSDPVFFGDGAAGLLLAGAGVGASLSVGRAGHAGARLVLAVNYQMRARMRNPTAVATLGRDAWTDAPGVPPVLHALWFSLGLEYGLVDDHD